MGEKTRLETTLKVVGDSFLGILDFLLLFQEEEARVRKEEADLKLAEQAFDNFLQENDRKAMEAQKK